MDTLKNRQAGKTNTAWSLINDTLSNYVVMPNLYILDNEALIELKAALTKKTKYQLFPLYIHCRNAAEYNIKTWKNNFYLV